MKKVKLSNRPVGFVWAASERPWTGVIYMTNPSNAHIIKNHSQNYQQQICTNFDTVIPKRGWLIMIPEEYMLNFSKSYPYDSNISPTPLAPPPIHLFFPSSLFFLGSHFGLVDHPQGLEVSETSKKGKSRNCIINHWTIYLLAMFDNYHIHSGLWMIPFCCNVFFRNIKEWWDRDSS